MYNLPLLLLKKRKMSPCTPADLHHPHGPGLPSNDIMEMS